MMFKRGDLVTINATNLACQGTPFGAMGIVMGTCEEWRTVKVFVCGKVYEPFYCRELTLVRTTKPPIPSKRTKDSRDTALIEIDYIAPDRADRYIPTL